MPPGAALPARDYFPGLTGLRGVAAGWVMLFHFWLLIGAPRLAPHPFDLTALFSCGFIGVDLFFVLSGFLLGLPFLAWAIGARPFPNLLTFWKRRCLRVLPAYYVQLAVLILAGWIVTGVWPVDLRKLFAYLSMEFVYFDGIEPMLNGVWWSLPVEWNFYVVLPLLGLAFGRARWWLVALLVLTASVCFRLFCYDLLMSARTLGPIGYAAIIHLPARLDEFLFGMLAAFAHLRRPRPSARSGTLALLVGVAGIVALTHGLDGRGDIFATATTPWIFVYATLAGASLALIVHASASGTRLAARLFNGRVLAFLGTISYSLYLWHAIVFQVAYRSGFSQWAPVAHPVTLAVLLIPLAIAVSWVSYRLTEHPFLVTGAEAIHAALRPSIKAT